MRILICTQKVDRDDDVLGFMHRWIEEFAHQCARVEVICLYKGVVELPDNVVVHSLGKEEGVSRFTYVKRFFQITWTQRHQYDVVFVHMNQIYVLLGGLVWRMLGKRVGLWYAHGHVPPSLHVATMLAHVILTSTESGFRIVTAKKRVIGQGIDAAHFDVVRKHEAHPALRLIMVGRLSPIKDHATLLRAVSLLRHAGVAVHLSIVGGAGLPEQKAYVATLTNEAQALGIADAVHFEGSVPYTQIPHVLARADIFVNTSRTGSLDKAGLEAMAAGLPVITCNEAFVDVLGSEASQLMFVPGDAEDLARVIRALSESGKSAVIGAMLRERVHHMHSVAALVTKIREQLTSDL